MAGLEATLSARLAQREASQRLRRLTTTPPDAVDFSSNDYLSLSSDGALQRAFVRRFGEHVEAAAGDDAGRPNHHHHHRLLGSGGSRLLDGNSALAEGLEARLARFHAAPAALLFTSAYDANAGLLACAPQPGDVVLYDEAVHASTHDGLRLGRAGVRRPFAHASVVVRHDDDDDDDDKTNISRSEEEKKEVEMGEGGEGGGAKALPGLAEALEQTKAADARVRAGTRHVFVCVEAVYSMDGRALDLAGVVAAVEAALPRGNGYLVLDEVHATGVLGRQGRGLACAAGLEDRVWARVLGFGKAMGCAGGAVLCSPTTRSYLINYARPLIYTTSLPFPTLLALDLVYGHLASGAADAARAHLRALTARAHARLAAACARLQPPRTLLRLDPGPPPPAPILPVYTARPRALAAFCFRRGRRLLVRPIVAPTVPRGAERVRVCLHAANTAAQVDELAAAVEEWVRGQMAAAGASGDGGGGEEEEEEGRTLDKGARL